jgi:hypothetical protein
MIILIHKMSSLSQLNNSIAQYSPVTDFQKRISGDDFPFVLRGIQGGFLSFLLGTGLKSITGVKNIVIIVPTENDGEELYSDLLNVFEGEIYQSLIDNNVWSPAVYPNGWEKISE